ncbi:hypothetical protein PMAC_002786 [Pneumocystis sp. 'macacae']|nr:hypothetical protein PMAC_002786 [Pneumocystis sp. 'macacae']
MARAVKRRDAGGKGVNVYEDEYYLLALILKEDLDEQKCKEKLKEYCEELGKIDKDFNTHSKLKEICKDEKRDGKCTDLKNKIKGKCTPFKAKLQEITQKKKSDLTDEICLKNQEQCLFLEAACPTELKDDCNKLRNHCYQKKRDEVADEALLRALSGNLKDKNECKERLKVICPELGQESDELTKKCINLDDTCTSLVAAALYKCNSLKVEIEKVLNLNEELKKKGQSLLKGCHFYGKNCKNDESKCNALKDKCKEKEIVYLAPGSHFDPTRPEPTLAEKIGLKELYEEAAADGVVIEKPLKADISDLLVLLSEKENFGETKCKSVFKTKCSSIEHLAVSIKNLCDNNTEQEEKCKKYDQEFTQKKATLTTIFKGRNFDQEIMAWGELPTHITEYDCKVLQSDCFYFENQNSFETPCKNVKATCYKKRLDELVNEVLLEKLRGKFYHETGEWLEVVQKELINVCTGMEKKSNELFALCMQPMDAAIILLTDLHAKTNILQDHLDAKRDLPTRQHCTDLLKKCADLEQDSKHIEWPCRTLRHHCARLGVAEHLEEVFLQERVSDLDKFESCVETLRGRCSGWGRRGRTRYALGCVAPNATCTYLTQNVGAKCAVLGGRIQTEGIIAKANEQTTKEATCERWMPFCSKYMSSCGNLTAENGENCKNLKEHCDSFIKRQELELKVVDELKGYLKEKGECKNTLDKYCTEWKKANNGLEALCTDKTNAKNNNDDDVRNKLCEKLIEQVKKQCPVLERKLTEASEELKEKEKEYTKIKGEAVKAMGEASLVLVTTKATNSSGNKEAAAGPDAAKNAAQFRLVRRNAAAKTHITEKELKAFDLVSQTFSLYVELKEECEDSLKKCGFKVECPQCEDACGEINKICLKLEPLEVREHKVETSTTTTTTTTTIVGSEAGKAGTEQCTSIRTTDTWVTHTSTHTSTSTSTSTITSTVTLTSTRKCRPTKCTTEGEEAGEVKPSGGLRMRGWSVMKGVLLGMMISVMI